MKFVTDDAVNAAAFAHVLVPLDGSELARHALVMAGALAGRFGAELHLVGVATDEVGVEVLSAHLASVSKESPFEISSSDVVVSGDVVDAIGTYAEALQPGFVCMGSHGRGRLGGALLGSVAISLLTTARGPVVMVGPEADSGAMSSGGPILACVDGSRASEAILPIATSWAAALHLPLTIATVAEPVPEPSEGHRYVRAHGPDINADRYLDRLAEQWRIPGLQVTTAAVYDPIGPAEGLGNHLADHSATLLALTTHARTGIARAVLGSATARIVRASPVPVLVAPLPRD